MIIQMCFYFCLFVLNSYFARMLKELLKYWSNIPVTVCLASFLKFQRVALLYQGFVGMFFYS